MIINNSHIMEVTHYTNWALSQASENKLTLIYQNINNFLWTSYHQKLRYVCYMSMLKITVTTYRLPLKNIRWQMSTVIKISNISKILLTLQMCITKPLLNLETVWINMFKDWLAKKLLECSRSVPLHTLIN